MTDPIGRRAALRAAGRVGRPGVLGAARVVPAGTTARQVVVGGAGAIGGAVLGAAAASRPTMPAVPVPRLGLLLVTADALEVHELDPVFSRLRSGPPVVVPIREIETIDRSSSAVAAQLHAALGDGRRLVLETRRVGVHRVNPRVFDLVERLVAAL